MYDRKKGHRGNLKQLTEGNSNHNHHDSHDDDAEQSAPESVHRAKSAQELSSSAFPFVRRRSHDGLVLWQLWTTANEATAVQLAAIAINDLSQLELDALKSFAMDRLPDVLPNIGTWADLQPVTKSRRSSVSGFLKMFGKSKSEFNSAALDPSQMAGRRSTTRARLRSGAGDKASSTDATRVFGRALDELIAMDKRAFGMTSLRVPYIVHSTCEYIREHGLTTNGIFRITGSTRRIRMVRVCVCVCVCLRLCIFCVCVFVWVSASAYAYACMCLCLCLCLCLCGPPPWLW